MISLDHLSWNNGTIVKQSQPSPAFSNTYWPIFRKHAHLLIAWGHQAVKPEILLSKEEDEESITGLLYEAIEQILHSNRESWCSSYTIHNEAPIPGSKRKGKDRRKTDLFVERVTKVRVKYVFEAKPQNYHKPYQRTDYYVGTKGMERFLEGEYADYTAYYPEVGMIAYVLTDSVEIWQSRLKMAIDRRRTRLRLSASQKDVTVVDEVQYEWRSRHKRSSPNSTLDIYHILLNCVSD